MKKEIKKLRLNKKTISNLNEMEMIKKIGGMYTARCTKGGCGGPTTHCSQNNGNTCKTCPYTGCV